MGHIRLNKLASVLVVFFVGVAQLAGNQSPPTQAPAFRTTDVRFDSQGSPGFTLMPAASTGVWFTNTLQGDALLTNVVAQNGAGVALGDINGDGWADIYLCNLEGPNRLYLNRTNWQFEDIPIGDAACNGQFSTGAALADVDGDGDLDLLVNGVAAGTRLFNNDGAGRFTECKDCGLSRTSSGTTLAIADIDGDGDLDVYCAHYIDVMHLADPTTRFAMAKRGGQWIVTKVNDESTQLPKWRNRFEALPDGSVRELPEVHALYRNDGTGHFAQIQFDPGVFLDEKGNPIQPYRDWGLAAMFRDMNGDGAPDLYICNDNASPDRIWINTGRGTFRGLESTRLRHTSRSSMGVDFADINRDGRDDFIVVDMLARDPHKRKTQLVRDRPDPAESQQPDSMPRYNRNTLFLSESDGSYTEAAFMGGVAASDWSWCPLFIDVDLDGYEDLLVTNGFVMDVMDQDTHDSLRQRKLSLEERKRMRRFFPTWPTPNAAFRNRGDGTFEPAATWGFDANPGFSYGAALADLDNDGDLDGVVNNLNGAAGLYKNNCTTPRLQVRLKGVAPNTHAVGARVRLESRPMTQSQEIICGGRYLSSDQACRVFATAPALGTPMRLQIRWRNGAESMLEGVLPNRIYEIEEPRGLIPASLSSSNANRPIFSDAAELLGHSHVDSVENDWNVPPLLPRSLSRLGPGLAWYDIDADGWEDLVIGGGRGGGIALLRNDKGTRFSRLGSPQSPGAHGAVLGWTDNHGERRLLVTRLNEITTRLKSGTLDILSLSKPDASSSTELSDSIPGPMSTADIDGDGDLDVFVGGRLVPGRYPVPASSFILANEEGNLRVDRAASEAFKSIGLVCGSTFADLDNDGDLDLVLAMEWGPIRVFQNNKGRFVDNTGELGLAGFSGWWTGVVAGDFNGDGRLDLACGNWGLNSAYELYKPGPLRLYYGDWNNDGGVQLVEAWKPANNWEPIRDRAWLGRGLPALVSRFPTHETYAKATIHEVLGIDPDTSAHLETAHLSSMVFINHGNRFDPLPLPREAQLAPAFSVNVGDFDADGIEDLFVSQNSFGGNWDISREDGGRGLWLKGIGDGHFTALESARSGIRVPGEQRGAALADFNHDGKVDVAVAQNNAPTRLFVNQSGRRGLRVRVHGTRVNPEGIGSQLRVVYRDGGLGPCRAIQSGSGYWSQDSAVPVLGSKDSPASVWIRSPDGNEQTVPVADGAGEVVIQWR